MGNVIVVVAVAAAAAAAAAAVVVGVVGVAVVAVVVGTGFASTDWWLYSATAGGPLLVQITG